MSNYQFEVFCIEPQDLKDDSALQKALSFSAQLWDEQTPVLSDKDNIKRVSDKKSGITIKIIPVDTSKIWTGDIEVAFILKVESTKFETLDLFRERLLKHLRDTLRFRHKRILRDDISTSISNQLYPEINTVEILLRRYLIKFFIQKIGLNWWELTANSNMEKKVSSRRKDRKDILAGYIDTDLEYIDFNELGELIYKQSSGFNQPEKVIEKISEISSMEEFEKFRTELDGNYSKYFKKYFKEKNFESLWSKLIKIRNKVAHQGSFHKTELDMGLELAKSIKNIITDAENEIDSLVLSIDEKEAIRNTAIEQLEEINSSDDDTKEVTDKRIALKGPTIVGKIDLGERQYKTIRGHKVITESEMIEELENAEDEQYNSYVGLKWFVTTYLADRNYSIGFSYSLLNIMVEKGLIEIYSIKSYSGGYDINAIKLPIKDNE
ncbi:MAG: HEPN domain-containing protein [Flavobacteriales bacterium]|nr:HEPN domain-containing protein [Flavobacteriales bacterium]